MAKTKENLEKEKGAIKLCITQEQYGDHTCKRPHCFWKSHAGCKPFIMAANFCTLYADLPFKFKMSPLTDIEADLREAKAQMNYGKNNGVPRTFLTGAKPHLC